MHIPLAQRLRLLHSSSKSNGRLLFLAMIKKTMSCRSFYLLLFECVRQLPHSLTKSDSHQLHPSLPQLGAFVHALCRRLTALTPCHPHMLAMHVILLQWTPVLSSELLWIRYNVLEARAASLLGCTIKAIYFTSIPRKPCCRFLRGFLSTCGGIACDEISKRTY
jgi:hypothetical protein